jgi:hypothetical protein
VLDQHTYGKEGGFFGRIVAFFMDKEALVGGSLPLFSIALVSGGWEIKSSGKIRTASGLTIFFIWPNFTESG